MNNRIKKCFIKIFLAMILLYGIITPFYSSSALTLSEMEDKAQTFINTGSKNVNIDVTNVTKEFSDLGQILTMIGAGVMVAITAYMGIKYLTAGPEAQAKLKVQLIGVVVSGMVIFGAYYIWKIVVNIASTF